MSIELSLYTSVSATINAADLFAGTRNSPKVLTLDGARYDVSKAIVNSSGDDFNSAVLWASGDGGLDTFDFLWLESDANVLVALQDTNSDSIVMEVAAGVPLILGSDTILDGTLGSDGSATTAADVIDLITVKNNTSGASATVTANVRLILID